VLAINARKGWVKTYSGGSLKSGGGGGLEDWIDSIRMGEGVKIKLPADMIVDAARGTGEGSKGAQGSETASEKAAEDKKKKEKKAEKKEVASEPVVQVESVEELSDEELERLLAQAQAAEGKGKGKGASAADSAPPPAAVPEHGEL